MLKLGSYFPRFISRYFYRNSVWLRDYEVAALAAFVGILSETQKNTFYRQLKCLDVIDRAPKEGNFIFISDCQASTTYLDWSDDLRLQFQYTDRYINGVKENSLFFSMNADGFHSKYEVFFVNGGLRCLTFKKIPENFSEKFLKIYHFRDYLFKSSNLRSLSQYKIEFDKEMTLTKNISDMTDEAIHEVDTNYPTV